MRVENVTLVMKNAGSYTKVKMEVDLNGHLVTQHLQFKQNFYNTGNKIVTAQPQPQPNSTSTGVGA